MQAFIAGYCEISLIKSVSERRNYFEPGTDEYYNRKANTSSANTIGLDKLCMDGFSLNINGYDYYIDSNNYLSFAMIIDYSNFKEVYNQCYAKDNFNLYI